MAWDDQERARAGRVRSGQVAVAGRNIALLRAQPPQAQSVAPQHDATGGEEGANPSAPRWIAHVMWYPPHNDTIRGRLLSRLLELEAQGRCTIWLATDATGRVYYDIRFLEAPTLASPSPAHVHRKRNGQ